MEPNRRFGGRVDDIFGFWPPVVGPLCLSRAVFGCSCLIWTQLSISYLGCHTFLQAGTGGGRRNSSIRCRISRNRCRGTATSASWNVT